MIKVEFSKLNLPRGLGLSILAEFLTEEQFVELITRYKDKPRKQRRIILPSRWCVRKCFFHFVWGQILNGKFTWDYVKKNWQRDFGTLRFARAEKFYVKQFYTQREKEILQESK